MTLTGMSTEETIVLLQILNNSFVENRVDIAAANTTVWAYNIGMNLLIFIIFLFISTPTSALNIVQWIIGFQSEKTKETEIISTDPLVSKKIDTKLVLKLNSKPIKSTEYFGHLLRLLAIH
jgi:hypothetical protein